MQMVLVFDDQTHAMTVKILDIETQKVQQPLLSAVTASASSAVSPSSASRLSPADASAADASGPPASGALVDTTA